MLLFDTPLDTPADHYEGGGQSLVKSALVQVMRTVYCR